MEWRADPGAAWSEASSSSAPFADRDVWTAALPVGRSGSTFQYRIGRGDEIAASGRGRAAFGAGRPVRFAVLGDVGDGSAAQLAIAARLTADQRSSPIDFGLIAGDIAYECGRSGDYTRRFFPVFNPVEAGDAALMRGVPFTAAVGNHDVGDLRWPLPPFRCSSDYAFFSFWRHPEGPAFALPTGPRHRPRPPSGGVPSGGTTVEALLSGANYSFSWGDAHVTVLDSNRYVNWADRSLQEWLEATLSAGQASRWRFVLMHHPPFSVSSKHGGDQWSRYLVPAFERHRVTVVFSGHVHNFQWFGPARFTPDAEALRRYEAGERGRLRGSVQTQRDFDGVSATDARGPVYIVSGAGGGSLVREGRSRQCPPDLAAPEGCGESSPIDTRESSVTIAEVTADTVTIRQLSASGATLLARRIR